MELNLTNPPAEITIREGVALPIQPPAKVTLSGNIESPANFVINRKKDIPANKTNVVFDYSNNTIVLTVDEESFHSKVITGKLEEFEALKEFCINAKKSYSVSELINLLKFKRAYFKTREDHAYIINQLQSFVAKTEIEFQNTNDFKGNAAFTKISKCKTNIDYSFFLNIPIFKTIPASTFEVEIEFEPKDGGIICWLVSPDLAELKIKIMDELFAAQLPIFSDYVIIKK